MPKLFRMKKGDKIAADIFKGSTINTPSMLCARTPQQPPPCACHAPTAARVGMRARSHALSLALSLARPLSPLPSPPP